MLRKTKKSISVLLSLLMVLSVFCGLGLTAMAAPEGTGVSALPSSSGTYYLESDVTINSTWNVTYDVTLDLNGHSIIKSGQGGVIQLHGSNVTMTIKDSVGTGKITGGTKGTWVNFAGGRYFGGGICVYDKATLVMEGGTISGNTCDFGGGGIGIYQATAILRGNVKITDNAANYLGGGVYIYHGGNSGSKIVVSDQVEITGNRTTENRSAGGGIHAAEKTPICLSGAPIIKDNSSHQGSTGITAEQYLTIDGPLTGNPGDIHVFLNIGGYNGTRRGKLANASEYIDNAAVEKFTSDNNAGDSILRIGNELWLWNKQKDTTGQAACEIKYNSLGGTEVVGQTVMAGEKASEPTVPAYRGYSFDGWYETAAYDNGAYTGQAWNFSTNTVTNNITLYAKWTPVAATAPTINDVTGAGLIYGYTDGEISVSATAAEGHTLSYQWYNAANDSPIENATAATYTIPTGKAAGTQEAYYCIVTATRTDNGQTATATSAAATVTVSKADPTYTAPTDLTANCNDTLESIALPEGWTWNDPTETVGVVGPDAAPKHNTFAATFTPADTDNYNTVSETLTVTVSHDLENHDGQPATCVEEGWNAYQNCKCEGCGYTTYEAINATGAHVWEWVIDRNADCGNNGVKHQECKNCHAVQAEGAVIEATGQHTAGEPEINTKPATCGEEGYTITTTKCAVCGEVLESTTLVMLATGKHTTKIVNAKEATATEDGYTGDEVCTVCGQTIKTGEVIPAKGEQTPDEPTPDTPDEPSNDGFRCGFCDRYEAWKDIPFFGWVVSLVHLFVHMAAHISYLS